MKLTNASMRFLLVTLFVELSIGAMFSRAFYWLAAFPALGFRYVTVESCCMFARQFQVTCRRASRAFSLLVSYFSALSTRSKVLHVCRACRLLSFSYPDLISLFLTLTGPLFVIFYSTIQYLTISTSLNNIKNKKTIAFILGLEYLEWNWKTQLLW